MSSTTGKLKSQVSLTNKPKLTPGDAEATSCADSRAGCNSMVGWPVWEADNPATVLQRFGLIYVTGHSFNLSAFAVSTCLPAWTKGSLRSWRIRLSLKGSWGGQLLLGCAWQPSLLSLQWGSSFLKGVIPAVQAGLTSTCIYKRWRQAEPRPRWCL